MLECMAGFVGIRTGAALVTKIRQPDQAFLAIQFVPVTDRVIVEIENLRDLLAAHSVIEQKQCIRSPRQACLSLPIPHQRDEVRSDGLIKKTAANHAPRRIAPPELGKPFFWQSTESGYSPADSAFFEFSTGAIF